MSYFVGSPRSAAFALALAAGLCVCSGVLAADESSQPKASATRPAKEQPGQSSVPSNAPPATRTETTGAANQDASAAKMNEDAKKKLETEGK